ncbi:putative sugar kinase YdjH [Planctomycetes bacterium Pan216]|uniref:Putative sugar kinase YdjH n=1 Tax=Kolteria novifilia TaxID=2527975 RepID=A0A518B5S0_9BACT|nr:putative sugar kinase YdjH [Planctomycetes bacterium Pan216]
MVNRAADVVGIGAVTWDRFLVVPRYPNPDDKVRAIQTEECGGGQAATALVALSRWGLQTRLVAMLGYDDYSERIIQDLDSENVGTERLIRREDADGRRTTVLVDNRSGKRAIVSGPHWVPPMRVDEVTPDLFDGARVLHLDTTVDECALEAAVLAKEKGLLVTLDAEVMNDRTEELLRHCDYVIASREFAQRLTGEEKLGLATYGLSLRSGKPAIVTDGEHGCDYANGEKEAFHQPAYRVPVVDGTGAGDVFHAAIIYGVLSAFDIRKTVRFAAWAAANVCREVGGRKGIPSRDDVHRYLYHDKGDAKSTD